MGFLSKLFGGRGGGGTPAQTEQERELARRGAANYNDYQQRFVPLEQQFLDSVQFDQADVNRLRGEANASAASAVNGATQGVVTQTARTGIGSGANTLAIAGVPLVQASAAGQGGAPAEAVVRNREIEGKTKFAALGRGYEHTANTGLVSAAQDATRSALTNAQLESQKYTDTLGGLSKALGYAGGRWLTSVGQRDEELRKNPKAGGDSPNAYRFWGTKPATSL